MSSATTASPTTTDEPGSPCSHTEENEGIVSEDVEEERSSYLSDEFYSDVVVFEVEKTHFRVFKGALSRPGSFFETLFSLPHGPSAIKPSTPAREGSSDENPIRLYDIKKADFGSLLRILCPYEGAPPCSTYDEWLGVLRLATMWDFPQARQKAITWLTIPVGCLPPISQISVAKQFEVKQWLITAYVKLVVHVGPLSKQDLTNSGVAWDALVSLYSIRDEWFQSRLGPSRTYPELGKISPSIWFHFNAELARKMVVKEFAAPLAMMRND